MKKAIGKTLSSKSIGLAGGISLAWNAYSTIGDYKSNRQQGKGKLNSAISAAGNAVMFEAFGWGVLGFQALEAAPKAIVGGALKANSMARSMDRASRNTLFNNSTFVDSKQAYTMRQAGMQLAENSKYNLQQTLMGNEASSMHRL